MWTIYVNYEIEFFSSHGAVGRILLQSQIADDGDISVIKERLLKAILDALQIGK